MEIAGAGRRIVGHLILAAWLTVSPGCLSTKVRWREPDYRPPLHTRAPADSDLLRAELAYAAGLQSEKESSENCVDLYFQAAALTQCADAQCSPDNTPAQSNPSAQIHKAALAKLIVTGQQFGRLDARSGLTVVSHGQRQMIPVTHHGFVWDAEDFECLEPVGDYSTQAFRVAHRTCGCGVPLVVSSSCKRARPFLADKRVFAATAVLRGAPASHPLVESSGAEEQGSGWALELYDPLRVDTLPSDAGGVPLAKDVSAPLAYRLRGERRDVLGGFFTPQPSEIQSRLYALEPYQPGKVPVVFIHGLLSDPFTWAEAVNELSAAPGFVDRFQIWLFEYPTGEPFLFSAASMREQLAQAQRTLDPAGVNSQFSEMVLVGHSMGGLISKLQVTSSGDKLWKSIANRPIEQTVMQPAPRKRMTAAFFFEPSPLVARVVFIGTPHQGSADARRLAGRVASLLVVEPPQRRERHREIIANNPGVFSPEFTRRMPTSIDLLDPTSALLQALYTLPITECVDAHSIIGDSCWTIGYGPSDGVVPVSSARYPNVASERYIDTTHAKLNKDVEAIDELHRILKAHLQAPRGEAALAGAQ